MNKKEQIVNVKKIIQANSDLLALERTVTNHVKQFKNAKNYARIIHGITPPDLKTRYASLLARNREIHL